MYIPLDGVDIPSGGNESFRTAAERVMKKLPKDKICKNCQFWDKLHRTDENICRRFPPTSGSRGTSWSYTEKNDWCGEFKAK